MNDRGYYVAECAGCGWKSFEQYAESDAEIAAKEHEGSVDKASDDRCLGVFDLSNRRCEKQKAHEGKCGPK